MWVAWARDCSDRCDPANRKRLGWASRTSSRSPNPCFFALSSPSSMRYSQIIVSEGDSQSGERIDASADPMACFHPVTAAWFKAVFDAPTAPQRLGWPVIARGENALILAPTGTGKTLAAFLWCLDRLMLEDREQVSKGAREQENRERGSATPASTDRSPGAPAGAGIGKRREKNAAAAGLFMFRR